MGMGPYTKDMRIEDVKTAPPKKEEGLATKKSPPPYFDNKKHGQEGVGIGEGMGAGGW